MEAAPALAGQTAGLIDSVKSAQQIIEDTVAEFFKITARRVLTADDLAHLKLVGPNFCRRAKRVIAFMLIFTLHRSIRRAAHGVLVDLQ